MAKRKAPPEDPKEVDQQVRITDFAGMACGLDLHDTDPGETYYQVNVVPFHPGELRVRRGFVVCQFESAPSVVLVAPPMSRAAEASSSIFLHSDARRARDIPVAAWQKIVISAGQPTTNWHSVSASNRVVLTGASAAHQGNANSLIASTPMYSVAGGSVIFISRRASVSSQILAATGAYPGGTSVKSGVANMLAGYAGSYSVR